jgi:hypothetical protein
MSETITVAFTRLADMIGHIQRYPIEGHHPTKTNVRRMGLDMKYRMRCCVVNCGCGWKGPWRDYWRHCGWPRTHIPP